MINIKECSKCHCPDEFKSNPFFPKQDLRSLLKVTAVVIGKSIEACCKPRRAHKTLILFGSVHLFSGPCMFQVGVVEPLTWCLFILPSGSTSGRSGIWACLTMPWFLNDSLVPTAKRSDITISTYLGRSQCHSLVETGCVSRNEVVLHAFVFNIALRKCMPYVHICGVFTVFQCVCWLSDSISEKRIPQWRWTWRERG